MTSAPFVKICGITRPQDARAAVDTGADAIGVVMASDSPRSCTVARAREIFAVVPPGVLRVVVSHTDSAEGLAACLAAGPDAIQLSQPIAVPPSAGVAVIRVVAPGGPIPPDCAMVIVDGSHGRGRPFDPSHARRVVASSPVPVLLAGGLSPETVGAAIREVRPFGVDVASGVEAAPGVKDHARVRAFVRAAKRAYPND
ncbi:MAG: phosphoribosylanthranilate isomerase [Methanospirillum sp.]